MRKLFSFLSILLACNAVNASQEISRKQSVSSLFKDLSLTESNKPLFIQKQPGEKLIPYVWPEGMPLTCFRNLRDKSTSQITNNKYLFEQTDKYSTHSQEQFSDEESEYDASGSYEYEDDDYYESGNDEDSNSEYEKESTFLYNENDYKYTDREKEKCLIKFKHGVAQFKAPGITKLSISNKIYTQKESGNLYSAWIMSTSEQGMISKKASGEDAKKLYHALAKNFYNGPFKNNSNQI